MNLTEILSLAAFPSFLMVLFYLTDALPEYLRLFGANKLSFLKLDDYFEKLRSPAVLQMDYFTFLSTVYENFIFNLLACPFCLGVWLALLQSLAYYGNIYYVPEIYMLSMMMFFGVKKLSS